MQRHPLIAAIAGLFCLLAGTAGAWAQTTMDSRSDFDKEMDKIKQPCEFFKWGADLRLRDEYLLNAITLTNNGAEKDRERHFNRYRARLWGTVMDSADTIEGNVRMTWEGR